MWVDPVEKRRYVDRVHTAQNERVGMLVNLTRTLSSTAVEISFYTPASSRNMVEGLNFTNRRFVDSLIRERIVSLVMEWHAWVRASTDSYAVFDSPHIFGVLAERWQDYEDGR